MNEKILLIDDHTLFREGLLSLLARRNIKVVASVGDGEEGIQLAKKLKPDIVITFKPISETEREVTIEGIELD